MSNSKKPDANETAARVVREATAKHEDKLPANLEAAWEAWAAGVGKVDARGMALLRAAFDAGAEAASGPKTAIELGRRGGLKGGKARAAKLSAEQRKDIAKKAAAKRWGKVPE